MDLCVRCSLLVFPNICRQSSAQTFRGAEHESDKLVSLMCEQEDSPPASTAPAEQMFYSTVSTLDRRSSGSSDDDIYSLPPAASRDGHTCSPSRAGEVTDGQSERDALDRDRHRKDQVRLA